MQENRDTDTLADDNVSRKPQQGRSKASLARMVAAAEKLMLERGSEEFTLQEVSQTGNVSIGSIYLRFDGKDNLVRAVIADHLERLVADEARMIEEARTACKSLAELVPHYVDAFAEILRAHAPLLRLTMLRAEHDSQVAAPGKNAAFYSERIACDAILAFAEEIKGPSKEMKASSAYHIIFAALARQLSLGSTNESAVGYDWSLLKRELSRMCLAYLKHAE